MMACPNTCDQVEENTLITLVAGGDTAAFESLYRRFHPRLFAFVFRTIRRPELVEEVVDDVLLAVWRGAAEFAGRSRVSTWIFGIAYRLALKALERETRRERWVDVDGAAEPELADARAQRRELAEALELGMRALSPEHRAVLELAVVAELGYREIAQIVGCPVNTVKTRMFHARRRLREDLERAGLVP